MTFERMSRNGLRERLAAAHDDDLARLLDDEDPPPVAGRRGDVDRAVEVADLDQAHAAAGRCAALRPGCELPVSSLALAVALVLVAAFSAFESEPQPATSAAAARASATAGRSIRAGCHGLVTQVAPGLTARHEPAQLRRRGDRCRPRRGGVRRAARRRRPRGRARRASSSSAASAPSTACMPSKALLRPGQALAEARRIPGAAEAVDGARRRRPSLERRDEVVHDLDDAGQLPWLEDRGDRARARARAARRRARACRWATRRSRRAARWSSPRAASALLPPIPGLREARPWTNREATTAEEVPAEPARPRRRPRRRRDGHRPTRRSAPA